jgi:hypothetical protein
MMVFLQFRSEPLLAPGTDLRLVESARMIVYVPYQGRIALPV